MKCKCGERKALFLDLNGHNLYRCVECGRLHTNRGIRTEMPLYRIVVLVSIVGWIALIVYGALS